MIYNDPVGTFVHEPVLVQTGQSSPMRGKSHSTNQMSTFDQVMRQNQRVTFYLFWEISYPEDFRHFAVFNNLFFETRIVTSVRFPELRIILLHLYFEYFISLGRC